MHGYTHGFVMRIYQLLQHCFFRMQGTLLLITFYTTLCATSNDSIRYGADMTHLPFGSDIAAMGDAGVVLPRRAIATLWNPATAALLQRYECSAEIADLYHSMSQQACFSAAAPVQQQYGAAINYVPFFSGAIEQYDSLSAYDQNSGLTEYTPKGYFQNNQHMIVLALGKKIALQLPRRAGTELPLPFDIAVGSNLKGYIQTMNPDSRLRMGMGANIDVGFLGRIGLDYDIRTLKSNREILLGATLRDILPNDIIWIYSPSDYTEPFHISQYYGIAYTDRSNDFPGNWTLALSLQKEYVVTYHGGVEAEFWNTVVFRAGFSDRVPTVGAGVHYEQYFIDYAFRFDEIGFSYIRVAVGLSKPAQ